MLPKQGAEFFRNISAVAEELHEKSPREARSRLTIIYVPMRDHDSEQIATITDHQVNFEAVEPARAGLAAFGQFWENLVRLDPQVVADLDRCRVNEGDARTRYPFGKCA